MRISEEGMALIRRFEGFRNEAYRDAVGVWTIGYGHTSMAGPPQVRAGLRISAEEAATILARDVNRFAEGVTAMINRPLSDAQFSALVSFAYNVGLGNFRKSSVLKAVNAGQAEAVPRRLNLWVKAGGRTLPGLVKRRAAEGALFVRGEMAGNDPPEALRPGPASDPIETVEAKPLLASRTAWAACLAAAAAAGQALLSPRALALVLAAVVLAAAAFIIFERNRKRKEEGV